MAGKSPAPRSLYFSGWVLYTPTPQHAGREVCKNPVAALRDLQNKTQGECTVVLTQES